MMMESHDQESPLLDDHNSEPNLSTGATVTTTTKGSSSTASAPDGIIGCKGKIKKKKKLKKDDDDFLAADQSKLSKPNTTRFQINGKTIVSFVLISCILFILYDSLLASPEHRFIQPKTASLQFLQWVEQHPSRGMGAILIVIAICVVFMLPVGTPLTLGCGYIYKHLYGWTAGVALATAVSMAGSALGAVTCFLLGRYLMRDFARKWVRKYPLFDAIDVAVAEHGLRIMAMLYLTPVLPLGPVSYMCGSTSMALSSFVLAKVASLPLMVLYVFMGASAGTLMTDPEAIEHNSFLIFSGICLSSVMIACVSRYVRKELMKILERQRDGGKKDEPLSEQAIDNVEMGMQGLTGQALQRRHAA